MERKTLYYIQAGKFNNVTGTGFSDRVSDYFDSLLDARVALQERVDYEKKTYKDWNCHQTEHIEVQLIEAIYDVDDDWKELVDFEFEDIITLNYKGEIVC